MFVVQGNISVAQNRIITITRLFFVKKLSFLVQATNYKTLCGACFSFNVTVYLSGHVWGSFQNFDPSNVTKKE